MNKFMGVGSLPRDGVLNGPKKNVLRFTLGTLVGFNRKSKKDIWAYVPCVVFRPTDETVGLLTTNAKSAILSLEGRVITSTFEKVGEKKYSTEVVVDQESIRSLSVNAQEELPV